MLDIPTANSAYQSHPTKVPKEPIARGPADDYFETKAPVVWDMIDFLDQHKLDCTADQLSHSWKEALSRVTKSTSAAEEMKERANTLLNKWLVSTSLIPPPQRPHTPQVLGWHFASSRGII